MVATGCANIDSWTPFQRCVSASLTTIRRKEGSKCGGRRSGAGGGAARKASLFSPFTLENELEEEDALLVLLDDRIGGEGMEKGYATRTTPCGGGVHWKADIVFCAAPAPPLPHRERYPLARARRADETVLTICRRAVASVARHNKVVGKERNREELPAQLTCTNK